MATDTAAAMWASPTSATQPSQAIIAASGCIISQFELAASQQKRRASSRLARLSAEHLENTGPCTPTQQPEQAHRQQQSALSTALSSELRASNAVITSSGSSSLSAHSSSASPTSTLERCHGSLAQHEAGSAPAARSNKPIMFPARRHGAARATQPSPDSVDWVALRWPDERVRYLGLKSLGSNHLYACTADNHSHKCTPIMQRIFVWSPRAYSALPTQSLDFNIRVRH